MRPDQCRVLVAEDEPLVRNEIAAALRDAGWEVVETASAEAAMALLKQHEFSVVFTDIQLQGRLTGWDLAEACRGARPHIGVIYTSGNCTDRSRSVEGSRFFGKPYAAADGIQACAALGPEGQA